MTVLATDSSKLFAGSGNAGPFTWSWRFLSNGHIEVVKIINGIEIPLTEGVDYQITGAGSYSGGSLTTTETVEGGEQIFVKRATPAAQAVDLRGQGDFSPEVYEDALDLLCMIIQDQQRDLAAVQTELAELAATTQGAAVGVTHFYVSAGANGPITLPAQGSVRVAKAASDVSLDPLHIIPGVDGQTIEGLQLYRDGLTQPGETVTLVFSSVDNTWYAF